MMTEPSEGPAGYSLVGDIEEDEAFLFLKDLYENQTQDSRLGGRWTRSLVKSELGNGSCLGFRDSLGYLRALLMYRELPGVLEISILGTAIHHRRRGLMKALVLSLKRIGSTGRAKIQLEVHCLNHQAQSFYRALGFSGSGVRKAYYSDGSDALLMDWQGGGSTK